MTDTAVIRDYDDLIAAMRERQAELGISNADFEVIAGLPLGYLSKLLGPARVKAFGPMSFSAVLGTLGLALTVTEDAEAVKRIAGRYRRCEKRKAHGRPNARRLTKDFRAFFQAIGSLGGKARMVKMTPMERRRVAQLGAEARWSKKRRKRKARATIVRS